jgi:hypothetical protein
MEASFFTISRYGARAAPERDSPLKIVGVYADQSSHTLAMSVLRNTARHCSAVCKLHSDWWSFDMLEAASEREAASNAAAHADMIWCATNACEVLPPSVTVWAERWSARRDETDGALVALLRCPAGYAVEQSPPRVYLCHFAQAAGLEFFAQRFDCDCRASIGARLQATLGNEWYPYPVESRPERGQIHWGINE